MEELFAKIGHVSICQTMPILTDDLIAGCLEAAGSDQAGLVILAASPRAPGADPQALLLAGIAVREPRPDLVTLLRPVGRSRYPAGRFHAARFRQVLPEIGPDVDGCCRALFRAGPPQEVLALGSQGLEFTRGACWIGPVVAIKTGPR